MKLIKYLILFTFIFNNTFSDNIEEYFNSIKKSSVELTAFVRKLPKGGDLHNHATGAYYTDHMIDYVREKNLFYNPNTKKFEEAEKKSPNSLDYNEFIKKKLPEVLDLYSMRGVRNGNVNGHDHFFNTFFYTDSAEPSDVIKIIENIVERNIYENINYLELMVQSIPKSIRNEYEEKYNEIFSKKNFSLDDLENYYNQLKNINNIGNIGIIQGEMLKREKKIEELNEKHKSNITVNYIQQLKRISTPKDFFLQAYYSMYFASKIDKIVAVNIVQGEDHPLSRNSFDSQMKILNFLYKKFKKDYNNTEINFTLHAGELVLNESPVEAMKNRISSSLYLSTNKEDYDKDKNHQFDKPITKRIGHGISIGWEEDFFKLINGMKKYKVPVEICLTSNEGILGIKDSDHPFMLYKKYDIPMCISTDDEGVNRSNLTQEYVKAISRYDLTYAELKNLIRNTIEYSFLSGESLFVEGDYTNIKSKFKEIIEKKEWEKFKESDYLVKHSPKLKKQIELEKELTIFEEEFLNF